MRTLAERLSEIFDQISRVFRPNRYPHRARFYFRTPQLFFTRALVRTVARQEDPRPDAAQIRRLQK